MNRMTTIAIYIALTAAPGMLAHAQPASTSDAKSQQTQRAGDPVIHCTHSESGTRGLQPCRVRQADEALRIGSNVTRQDLECVLSGKCDAEDRARING